MRPAFMYVRTIQFLALCSRLFVRADVDETPIFHRSSKLVAQSTMLVHRLHRVCISGSPCSKAHDSILRDRSYLPKILNLQVISTNAVIHVNQSDVRSILAVNGYARATVEDDLLGCPLRAGGNDWGWASFR